MNWAQTFRVFLKILAIAINKKILQSLILQDLTIF